MLDIPATYLDTSLVCSSESPSIFYINSKYQQQTVLAAQQNRHITPALFILSVPSVRQTSNSSLQLPDWNVLPWSSFLSYLNTSCCNFLGARYSPAQSLSASLSLVSGGCLVTTIKYKYFHQLSQCHSVTMLQCNSFIVSQCHSFIVSPCCSAIVS